MSTSDDLLEGEPPAINPYEVLQLDKSAPADKIKSAYRKLALKHHPDKVTEENKTEAHEKFQSIAFAYAVLSDPVRRKRYDETGSTSESVVDADGFSWSDFYREQFRDAISDNAIAKFAKKYKASDEEKDDLLSAYEQAEGNMDAVYETVLLSDPLEDDDRFRAIIDEAIANEDVPAFKAYTKESKKSREARKKAAKDEANEAEDYAKELGLHDKLFGSAKNEGKKGSKKTSKKDKGQDESGLAGIIAQRQRDRGQMADNFLSRIADKYAEPEPRKKAGKKRGAKTQAEDEPSEEAFQAAAARLKKPKK